MQWQLDTDLLLAHNRQTRQLDYLQELRGLADQCKSKSVTAVQAKEEALDALIEGMSSKRIRQKLLEYTDLTLYKAIETAIIFEQAEIDNYMYTESAQCQAVLGGEVNGIPTKTGPMYPEFNVHMSHNKNTFQSIPQSTCSFSKASN
ncbi:hypothetical protein GJ496_003792 [Pomphorhynchus laevis]|nr:hypothetical protein GJ496_003792 [Pomphorhynchus laevis]